MKIREALIEDCEAIADLIKTLSEKYIVGEFTEMGRNTFLNSNDKKSIEGFIMAGFQYHLAEDAGKIIGAVGIKENKHLFHLFVSEKHQGKGLARKLWETAKNKCLSSGDPEKFTVNSSNNAIPVYEAFGFKRTSAVVETNGVFCNPMCLELSDKCKKVHIVKTHRISDYVLNKFKTAGRK